jgi:hypothetical protein
VFSAKFMPVDFMPLDTVALPAYSYAFI